MINYCKYFFSLFFLSLSFRAFTQLKEFDNVIQPRFENAVTIRNNTTIVGYAFFYQIEKTKRAAVYRLEVMDENLKSIGNSEFEGAKSLNLVDAIYESEHIMLVFNDPLKVDGYDRFSKIFDLKGKEISNIPYEPQTVKKGLAGAQMANYLSKIYNSSSNIEGKGFINVFQSESKHGGANLQMIDKYGKLKWEKTLGSDEEGRMDVYLATTTANALIFYGAVRRSILAKDARNFLIGINPDNGKEIFRKPLEIDKMSWEPMLFKKDSNGDLQMICSLTHEEDKFYTARPIGFNIATLNDKTGQIKLAKNFLFEKDLSSIMNMKNESKSDDGFIKMHDLCLMSDGSKVLVGEYFRREISGAGLALKVMTLGNGTATRAAIGDLFLLRIDKNNMPVSLEKIEKQVRHMPIVDGLSVGVLLRMLTIYGEFGYLYTDESADNDKKTIVVKGAFDDVKFGTTSITFNQNKGFKVKNFTFQKAKRDKIDIMKAKPGHVLVIKYLAKEKRSTLNFERVD